MATPRVPDPGPDSWLGPLLAGATADGLGGSTKAQDNAVKTGTTGATAAGAKAVDAVVDATGIGGLVDALRAVARWTSDRHNWIRVGYVVGGGLMFAVGAALIAKPAATSVASVVPKGMIP